MSLRASAAPVEMFVVPNAPVPRHVRARRPEVERRARLLLELEDLDPGVCADLDLSHRVREVWRVAVSGPGLDQGDGGARLGDDEDAGQVRDRVFETHGEEDQVQGALQNRVPGYAHQCAVLEEGGVECGERVALAVRQDAEAFLEDGAVASQSLECETRAEAAEDELRVVFVGHGEIGRRESVHEHQSRGLFREREALEEGAGPCHHRLGDRTHGPKRGPDYGSDVRVAPVFVAGGTGSRALGSAPAPPGVGRSATPRAVHRGARPRRRLARARPQEAVVSGLIAAPPRSSRGRPRSMRSPASRASEPDPRSRTGRSVLR